MKLLSLKEALQKQHFFPTPDIFKQNHQFNYPETVMVSPIGFLQLRPTGLFSSSDPSAVSDADVVKTHLSLGSVLSTELASYEGACEPIKVPTCLYVR